MTEKLILAAIIRNGELHATFRSHAQIRQTLGDVNFSTSNLNDEEGFLTSEKRFVSRRDAVNIAIAAGQLPARWKDNKYGDERKLLSSDIKW